MVHSERPHTAQRAPACCGARRAPHAFWEQNLVSRGHVKTGKKIQCWRKIPLALSLARAATHFARLRHGATPVHSLRPTTTKITQQHQNNTDSNKQTTNNEHANNRRTANDKGTTNNERRRRNDKGTTTKERQRNDERRTTKERRTERRTERQRNDKGTTKTRAGHFHLYYRYLSPKPYIHKIAKIAKLKTVKLMLWTFSA